MDARIDPAKLAGLRDGDAHVIHNAGGRASDDAIRSLVIRTSCWGTRERCVIHHSNCGMEHTASFEQGQWNDPGAGPGSRTGEFIDWLTIENQGQSVVADVESIETHSLVLRHSPVYGYIYQVESGRLVEVPEATQAGRAG